jgi:hypothetical protein
LRARDLLRDFERDGLEVYNSLQTNLGAALATLNHLEDSPMVQRPRRRCSDRRKRSWIQQIRSKFLLQKQIGASSPAMS